MGGAQVKPMSGMGWMDIDGYMGWMDIGWDGWI